MDDNHWHLDRKVPIGIIFALVGQTLFFTYWGSTWKSETDNRLNSLEKYQTDTTGQENRIVVLEQQFSYIREDLAEIKVLIRENGNSIRKGQP
jgi:hypothetical protein